MEVYEQVHNENRKLLVEISNMKKSLEELYQQNGPSSSDYISLSIKLDFLIKEYIEEQLNLLKVDKEENQKTKRTLSFILHCC